MIRRILCAAALILLLNGWEKLSLPAGVHLTEGAEIVESPLDVSKFAPAVRDGELFLVPGALIEDKTIWKVSSSDDWSNPTQTTLTAPRRVSRLMRICGSGEGVLYTTVVSIGSGEVPRLERFRFETGELADLGPRDAFELTETCEVVAKEEVAHLYEEVDGREYLKTIEGVAGRLDGTLVSREVGYIGRVDRSEIWRLELDGTATALGLDDRRSGFLRTQRHPDGSVVLTTNSGTQYLAVDPSKPAQELDLKAIPDGPWTNQKPEDARRPNKPKVFHADPLVVGVESAENRGVFLYFLVGDDGSHRPILSHDCRYSRMFPNTMFVWDGAAYCFTEDEARLVRSPL